MERYVSLAPQAKRVEYAHTVSRSEKSFGVERPSTLARGLQYSHGQGTRRGVELAEEKMTRTMTIRHLLDTSSRWNEDVSLLTHKEDHRTDKEDDGG